MHAKKLEQLILHMESYVECWKQFNYFVNTARAKKFGPEEENQFLEVKSNIVQQLELITSAIEAGGPSREDVHAVIDGAPSLRFVSELNEGALRALETQWHKSYIGWQSLLGQLKVQRQQNEGKGLLGGLFGRK